jgi:hypothetical protein
MSSPANPLTAPITGTPIDYSNSEPEGGRFHPEGPIHKIASSIFPNIFPPGGSITVNPNNTADVSRVIKHESVHALLDPLVQSGKLDQLNAQNPSFAKLKGGITPDFGGDASTEMPAYAATGEINQLPNANPIISKQYRDTLMKQLLQLDPKLGKMYQQLAGQ